MCYIELNPVRANMVSHPGDYRWSSYRANGQSESNPQVTPHTLYLAMGPDSRERQLAYRGLFEHELDEADIHAIRDAAQFCVPLGNDRFKQQIEAALGRSTGYGKRGRPGIREEDALYF